MFHCWRFAGELESVKKILEQFPDLRRADIVAARNYTALTHAAG
jgi:uncharacterized protein (DUF433 family)